MVLTFIILLPFILVVWFVFKGLWHWAIPIVFAYIGYFAGYWIFGGRNFFNFALAIGCLAVGRALSKKLFK